jgi:hypothetical protein
MLGGLLSHGQVFDAAFTDDYHDQWAIRLQLKSIRTDVLRSTHGIVAQSTEYTICSITRID